MRAEPFRDGVDATLAHQPTASLDVVTDAAGQPLAGADAVLFRRCAHSENQRLLGARARSAGAAESGVDGHAQLVPEGTGGCTLCVFAYYSNGCGEGDDTGYADRCLAEPVTISPHTGAGPVDVRLQRAGAVRGIVTDAHGIPWRTRGSTSPVGGGPPRGVAARSELRPGVTGLRRLHRPARALRGALGDRRHPVSPAPVASWSAPVRSPPASTSP